MEVRIGRVTHYYNRIGVAVLELYGELEVGDTLHFVGRTTDFKQSVRSMEIDHRKVDAVQAGADVALLVEGRVREGDEIYKILEEV